MSEITRRERLVHVTTRRAFTLVELLVVIGIIALLIGILLPSLSRARENASRVACMSNLRQVGMAITMYMTDAKGMLPVAPKTGPINDYDAWWWQSNRINELGDHGLGPYLKLSKDNYKVLMCPGDDPQGRKYPFSYSFNRMLNGNGPKAVQRLTQVKNSAEKVMVYEEDERTIDDGNGEIWSTKSSWANADLLAIRHDKQNRRTLPDVPTAAGVPNQSGKGNVCFCDGHAEYVERRYAHSKYHTCPNPDDFPNDPEILP